VTVSTSALWEKGKTVGKLPATLERHLELGTNPTLWPLTTLGTHESDGEYVWKKVVLQEIFGTMLTSWLYSAAVEVVYKVTPPAWTIDEWSFVPLVLPTNMSFQDSSNQSGSSNSSSTGSNQEPGNVLANLTVNTPGIRARLDCKHIDMSKNTSNWLTTLDFTNKTAFNSSHDIPPGIKVGYELKQQFSLGELAPGYNKIFQKNPSATKIPPEVFGTFFADASRVVCCGNDTDGNAGDTSVGYWSLARTYYDYGYTTNIVIKWVDGKAFEPLYNSTYSLEITQGSPNQHFVWKKIPRVTLLVCTPIIETTNASVTIDFATQQVQDYKILDKPTNNTNAWSDYYVLHNATNSTAGTVFEPTYGSGYSTNDTQNVTIRLVLTFRHTRSPSEY
jgi:hypothetical protein